MVVKDIEFPSTSWDLDTGPGININENPSYCPTIYIYYTTWFVHYLYNDSIYTYVYNIYIYTYIIDIYNTYPLSSLERHSQSPWKMFHSLNFGSGPSWGDPQIIQVNGPTQGGFRYSTSATTMVPGWLKPD